MKKTRILTICFSLFSLVIVAQSNPKKSLQVISDYRAGAFSLANGNNVPPILIDTADAKVVSIAAEAFRNDILLVTGMEMKIIHQAVPSTSAVIAGTIGHSKFIDELIRKKQINISAIHNGWEQFVITIIRTAGHRQLIIAGSDSRGTSYGIFHLSKLIGVSPLVWWADVVPVKKQQLFVEGNYTSKAPSVKFRGIFLNDEDWGLQPWAAKTFEPEINDIGPKTYAKIFELLLRLKANLIWPAMHPSTKAFFYYPGNQQMATDYAIVVGSSHAEPMLRNNVGEWNEKTMGHFNYISNKDLVYKYWEERVKESKGINAIYTMGMRGVHDSKMEGVKDEKEAVPLMERIIDDQRGLLSRYIAKDVTKVPQVFTAYKEVLDIYDAGLKLPEDISLVWPDDNYGYIQRLNNAEEQKRKAAAGVYYHASYWGRPHDYLWLSSTHPSLIREEMMKAYETGANNLWVLNVGDIKPLEYNIEMFLDMAFDVKPFRDSRYVKTHQTNWLRAIFGGQYAAQMADMLSRYYQLAFERKPEFMGWSQTEPTTKTNFTAYNHFYYSDEAQQRIDAYELLEKEVKALRTKMGKESADAFYELLYYPVMGASYINKKFLYRDKAAYYAKQNRLSAAGYAAMSKAVYDSIVNETAYYNTQLANGKWKHMMSFKPRELPVYQSPELPETTVDATAVWSIAPEGFVRTDSLLLQSGALLLPGFDDAHKQRYFIDVFLSDKQTVNWQTEVSDNWIQLSQSKGTLTPHAGKNQQRVWVSIDWPKFNKESSQGFIVFKGNGKQLKVELPIRRLKNTALENYKGFVENNGFIVMHAAHFSRQSNTPLNNWQLINNPGYTGSTLQVWPLKTNDEVTTDPVAIKQNNAVLEYDFYNFTPAAAAINIYTLPTHPINNQHSMRYAVAVDDSPIQIADFKTFGRSEEWKQNVLSNRAKRKIEIAQLQPGKHRLKIYAIDPGVMLDEIRIDLGRLRNAYGVLPETYIQ